MGPEQDCFSKLTLNDNGFVDGIENCMHASAQPPILQISKLLPGIEELFPNAKGITYQRRSRIGFDGQILEDNVAQSGHVKPTEKELAAMHNLSTDQYQTLLNMMNSPIDTLPNEIGSELAGKEVGSLDGVDEVITSWLKKQESDNK